MLPKFAPVVRKFGTSLVLRNEPGGIPGVNLPFRIDNPYRLTAVFAVYFGTGMALPFLIVKHSLTK